MFLIYILYYYIIFIYYIILSIPWDKPFILMSTDCPLWWVIFSQDVWFFTMSSSSEGLVFLKDSCALGHILQSSSSIAFAVSLGVSRYLRHQYLHEFLWFLTCAWNMLGVVIVLVGVPYFSFKSQLQVDGKHPCSFLGILDRGFLIFFKQTGQLLRL